MNEDMCSHKSNELSMIDLRVDSRDNLEYGNPNPRDKSDLVTIWY